MMWKITPSYAVKNDFYILFTFIFLPFFRLLRGKVLEALGDYFSLSFVGLVGGGSWVSFQLSWDYDDFLKHLVLFLVFFCI